MSSRGIAAALALGLPGAAHAADDAALRYRSGLQVTGAAAAGAAVGLGLTAAGDLAYAGPGPAWVPPTLTGVGLLGLSFSTSMVGAGTLSAGEALRSAGCPTSLAPGVAAQSIGYVSTAVDVVAAVAAVVRGEAHTPSWIVAATSQGVSLAATGVRLGLGGVQLGLDRAAARRCPALSAPSGPVAPAPPVLEVGGWAPPGGAGLRVTLRGW